MRVVLQRVKSASVIADGVLSGEIGHGYLLLLGVGQEDGEEDVRLLAEKIAKMRIFSDENGKMNLAVRDVQGGALVVSNFTLLADYRHGNRPAFTLAAAPEKANALYTLFIEILRERIGTVESGVFGADMQIEMIADGPVTITVDSALLRKGSAK